MTTYTLKRISESTYNITSGRAKVGFVSKCPTGFVARIGTHCEVRATAKAAFEAVASKALGFNNAAEVRENNRVVRAQRRVIRAEVRGVVDEALNRGNFEPMFELLKRR